MSGGALSSVRLLPEVLGLVSGLLLLRPAFHLNSIAKLVWRLGQVEFDSRDDPFFEAERRELAERFKRRQGEWNRVDEFCLIGGLASLILSFLAKVFIEAWRLA